MKVTVTVRSTIHFPLNTLRYYSGDVRSIENAAEAVSAALREDFSADDPSTFFEMCTDSELISVEPS